MRLLKDLKERLRGDEGSASLEFITAGVMLLVPLVYLVVAVASIQGAALAFEGAARQAARVYVQSASVDEARSRVARAVEFALSDYGLDFAAANVTVTCAPDPEACLTRAGRVAVSVRVAAPLPLVPNILDLRTTASVPIEARAVQTVSRFWTGER